VDIGNLFVITALPCPWLSDNFCVHTSDEIRELPNLTFIPLDESLARLSAKTAAKYKLRGSEAIYAAVAIRFGAQLVTLDREQMERLKEAVKTREPSSQAMG